MMRIITITTIFCLAIACSPLAERVNRYDPQGSASVVLDQVPLVPVIEIAARSAPATGVELPTGSSSAVVVEVTAGLVGQQPEQYLDLQKLWPSGAGLQAVIDSFMGSGFMKNPSWLGFSDLAYSDVALDCITNGQGRISQIEGVFTGLYDRYWFGIPVVQRRVDAISGSKQINQEDVILSLDSGRWRIQPVSLRGGMAFEVGINSGIEFAGGDKVIRIIKTGSVFTCTESLVRSDGQETLLVSWHITQYRCGLVNEIRLVEGHTTGVPVVLAWEPGFIAGYIVSLPKGQAEFAQRLRLEPTGKQETDRHNFLVLLTQCHGAALNIPDKLGAVDPVWLALLMYDHVVNP